MINAKDNNNNSEINTKCEFCVSDDTTEHMFERPILQKPTQEEKKALNLESVDSKQEIRRIARFSERVNEIKIKQHDRCSYGIVSCTS